MSKKDLRIKYKNNYTLGVDVGSKYIGFAVLDTSKILNKDYQNIGGALNKGAELIYCDIETFETKNAKANKDRREFRHTRRNIRRQRQRLDDIKLFFEKIGLKEFKFLNNPFPSMSCPSTISLKILFLIFALLSIKSFTTILILVNNFFACSRSPINILNELAQPEPIASLVVSINCWNVLTWVAASSADAAIANNCSICLSV